MKQLPLLFVFLLGCITADVAQTRPNEITVFIARKIITMDPGWPTATVVAVRDGRILSVGRTLADLKPLLDRFPYRLDETFKDKILLPGFIDPHQHILAASLTSSLPNVAFYDTPTPTGKNQPGAKSKAEVLERLRHYEAALKDEQEPLIAWGYDATGMGEHLTKADLDQISRTRPIIVWDYSIHNIYVNSALLQLRNLTKETAKGAGVMRGADGELNGQFFGNNASHPILFPFLQRFLKPDGIADLLKFGANLFQQGGITTFGELAFGGFSLPLEEAALPAYFNAPTTPLRVVAVVHEPGLVANKGEQAIGYAQSLQKKNTDKFSFSGVKFLSDDAFMSLTMRAGYLDQHEGLWLMEPDSVYNRMLPWWKAGFRIHVHSNGEESQDVILAALARLQREYPRFDHRFTFEHLGLATTAQIRRLKALGANASVQAWYVYRRGELNADRLGTDRAQLAARLGTLERNGVPTALHTDPPVAPPQPLVSAWIAVNRIGQSGAVLAPSERVTVEEALRMITIEAAFVLGLEDKIGSIEAGKLADFTILEQDPLSVPPEKLKDIAITGTIVGGKIFPAPQVR